MKIRPRLRLVSFLFALLTLLLIAPRGWSAPPADGVIVFNEIMYNPAGAGEGAEWVELYNQMGVAVDLSDWQIEGGIDYRFADGVVLPGGGTLVIAKTPAMFPGALGPFTGSLSNSGETLRLVDNNGRMLDEVTYGDKGEWPIGPDGGGVSLSKRDAFLGSSAAANWTSSAQVGGTPGVINFPPPPAPVTTRVIAQQSPWKYEASGAAPNPAWKSLGFNDANWSTGDSAFDFGNTTVYGPMPPPVTPGGIWSTLVWTGDANSGISSAKSYTHKIGFNRGVAYTAINGVLFDSPGSSARSGPNWALLGANLSFTNNGSGAGANNLPAGSGSRQLAEEFFYDAAYPGGISRLEVTGLTPEQTYIITFYTTGFGGPGQRLIRVIPSDSNTPFLIDENATGSGNGMLVKYHYKAPGSGTMNFDFQPVAAGTTWHHYAFSNEVAGPVSPEVEISNVTIEDVSSELTAGYTRQAIHAVNGSGLSNGQHGITPDGAMWLSNGLLAAPNDPLPAVITFDLGSVQHLTSLHVWNYNERAGATDLTTRGAQSVEILTASEEGGAFTSAGTFTFIRASSAATEPGQHIELDRQNVRLVRFNIISNHGGDNQFAGLSEVKFFKEGLPASSLPQPYRSRVTSLFNSGVTESGAIAASGTGDLHYINTATNTPAIVQTGHPAWFGPDSVSQWIGLSANGQNNVAAGQFTYRTTFDLTGFVAGTEDIKFYVGADNSLDNVILNGAARGLTAAGFTSLVGPLTINGPFNPGLNTVDFVWSNAPSAPVVENPGGLRIRWQAEAAPQLAKTTLPTNPVTTYLRQKFTYQGNAASTFRMVLNYVVDDGAVFYLNGQEVHRVNMGSGPVNETTLASTNIVYPMFSGTLEIPSSALVMGENVFAVELHQASASDADAFFLATVDLTEKLPLPSSGGTLAFNEIAGATAGTFFVELRNTSSEPLTLQGYTVRSSSGAQYVFGAGTPLAPGGLVALDQATLGFRPLDGEKLFLVAPGGTAVPDAVVIKNRGQGRDTKGRWLTPSTVTPGGTNAFALNTAIVINEIMYHHHPTYLPTGTVDVPEEWIELYNRSNAEVALAGWKLTGGISFTFPAQTVIPPGGYLVVANDAPALASKFPSAVVVGNFSGSLSNSEDLIILEDGNDNPVNEVRYFSRGRWDERADGGGSSLELKNPMMDNSVPEAWAASFEGGKSSWQSFVYQGTAGSYPGSNDPTNYHEFIFGLLNSGEFLIDDISVKQVGSTPTERIQNGTFTNNAATWRLLGTHGSHGRSVVVPDPAGGGNVLKVVATGPTEHMHNHVETTIKSGSSYIAISPSATYNISFRARWISGTPRLHTRLYFNRLVRQHLLPMPANTGTPGAPNSTAIANAGPTFTGFSHAPVLPEAGTSATVRVAASDADGLSRVTLKWRLDRATAFNNVPMTLQDGAYVGVIPAQVAGALVQFYVEGEDALGAIATFPAEGSASRALIRWHDGLTPTTPGHGFRILMTTADTTFLHEPTNVMSNDTIPCTVVYRESEVFYDTRVRLKSSERGRLGDIRLGFAVTFDPMHKFRGAHEGINLDRSGYGRGTTGNGYGQSEMILWHFFNRASGVPSMFNDLIYLIAPRSTHNGSAMLTMAEFNDVYLDSRYPSGAKTPTFKYELIYFPLTTTGGPEGLKIPQPDDVKGVEIESIISTDKEAFRWNFLIGNARNEDNYSRLLNLNQVFRQTGTTYATNLPNAIDVDEWLRTAAALALAGVDDNYATTSAAWHNLKFYQRPDGRILYLPWDLDFQTRPATDSLIINADISKIISAHPANERIFYGHLLDIINTSFNTAYLNFWTTHYQSYTTTGGNWGEILTYVDARVAYARGRINALYPQIPFTITTNGGNDFSTSNSTTTLAGDGWVDVRTIRVQGSGVVLTATWTDRDSWQVTLPVAPGANTFTLEAVDRQGNIVGTDTVTVTGTGVVLPGAAGNLVISEVHYNPLAPTAAEQSTGYTDKDDFEFVEVRNVSAASVNLTGVRFGSGIDYTFPNTTLAPGEAIVVPRRTAAFASRNPGVTTAPQYFQATANFLDNGGEELALIAADGSDIVRFTYRDKMPWPESPDGQGPSLVLIAPRTAPDPADPLNWRASTAVNGNPGTSDALPLPTNPAGDDNGNGVADLIDYARGGGANAYTASTVVNAADHLTFTFERQPRADAQWLLEQSTDLISWMPAAGALTAQSRVSLPGGLEQVTLRAASPLSAAPAVHYRMKLRAQP